MGVISSIGDAAAIPVIDPATCTGCTACLQVCASNALSLGMDGGIQVLPEGAPESFGCIGCGQCMMVCPTGSITVTGRKLSPTDILELPGEGRAATADQLESLLITRRSIRAFTPKEVSRDQLDRVIRMASLAPMGIPPSEVGIVAFLGRDKVSELSGDVTAVYRDLLKLMGHPKVLAFMKPFLKRSTYEQLRTFILPLARILTAYRDKGEDYMLYDAPAALLFHTSPYADAADAYIACTYAMIAAASLGLGSCMIGCLTPPLARKKKLLRKYRIPAGHSPAIVLILGYPSVKFRRGVRRTFQSVAYY